MELHDCCSQDHTNKRVRGKIAETLKLSLIGSSMCVPFWDMSSPRILSDAPRRSGRAKLFLDTKILPPKVRFANGDGRCKLRKFVGLYFGNLHESGVKGQLHQNSIFRSHR